MLQLDLIRVTCSAAKVASRYAVSRRTLSRHLTAEGTSFRQLSNEVRCEIACMLLANSDFPVSQIAGILNYAETSAFTRAFHRWTGQSPSAWRRTHQGRTG
ncbi:helix-turn-helix domain-containing protein [Microvirga lotononidis]|uniref:DNA-binding domain-containing protein, AraC-type n=1 Tax=Microvirga lotononidis TaxID=864069 RepID=I4Z1T1_9HYPH|nr:AraC family transcriptional regulator [Microvirga lotononidis]EIM30173.1 DNA-binding domain-containing protein, AraC-type [Microvirga lotononidis]WQO31600.1 AraC family transcriptional regulator [Microvirga lotononidis]